MPRIALSTGLISFYDREFGRGKRDPKDFQVDLVFVIMALTGEGTQEVYSAIEDECKKLGLEATRVNENTGSGLIIREIVDLIERAEFIICDVSYERPNVYYELGYAHGVGNQSANILLTAREGTVLHFDIAPLRVRYYRSIEHLRLILTNSLREMILMTREKKNEETLSDCERRIREAEKELRIAKFDKLAATMSEEGLECPHCHHHSQHMSYRPRSARYPFFVCDVCSCSFTDIDLIRNSV